MKWIAALLLIVNVAVYLWASGKSVSVEQTTMYAKPDVNREGMLLLEEVRRDPFTAMAGTGVNLDSLPTAELDGREITGVKLGEEGESVAAEAPAAVPEEAVPAAASPVEEIVEGDLETGNVPASPADPEPAAVAVSDPEPLLACFRVGPFKSGPTWQAANEWMTAQEFAYRAVRSESRELRAVRVYLGPFESMEATRPVISQLKAKQLDHYPYLREGGKARISLGYFTQEELAEKFVSHLLTEGIEAKTKPEFRTLGPFEWMEASIDSRRQSLLLTRQWADPDAAVNRVECGSDSGVSG